MATVWQVIFSSSGMQIRCVNVAGNRESKSLKGAGSSTAFDSNLQIMALVKKEASHK